MPNDIPTRERIAMQQMYKLPLVLDPQPEGGWTITCPLLLSNDQHLA